MYSLPCKVTTSLCDSEGRLKLVSALQMMQDCSELWIDSEPAVRDYFVREGMAQFLVSRQVEVLREPLFKEDLTVTTSVFEMRPMFGFRNTFIYDAQGRPCYRTWSTGAFVELSTGRMKRIDDSVSAAMRLDPKLEMAYRDRHVLLPEAGEWQAGGPVRVMRSDIDYNRHMNNAQYLRVAMELLPTGFDVRHMRVEYRTPARLGCVLTPLILQTQQAVYVKLQLGDTPAAVMEFSPERL